ncbi:hypothetical protein EVAR_87035_1 [Eumeta japonica]|uniref:Uncharacterized protein n=1 Tax=Eumeta variegata TaxID=151549 RepID=A0A4C1Z0M9_EUMVA|nr:hypothetical protein EVAR_87035_1 [Eumeta japonica]
MTIDDETVGDDLKQRHLPFIVLKLRTCVSFIRKDMQNKLSHTEISEKSSGQVILIAMSNREYAEESTRPTSLTEAVSRSGGGAGCDARRTDNRWRREDVEQPPAVDR